MGLWSCENQWEAMGKHRETHRKMEVLWENIGKAIGKWRFYGKT